MTLQAGREREDGFALIAALGAAMFFALLAYAVLASDRGAITALDAQLTHARLEAAADAGVATALDGLGAPQGRRWLLDGRTVTLEIDGLQVDVDVEDERGKVALRDIQPEQARRLFQAAGATGSRLDQLTDNLLDWQDGAARAGGGLALDYAADGLRPRGAPMRTVEELLALRGMDQATFDRVAPALTAFVALSAEFDPSTASPLARQVMGPRPDDDADGGPGGAGGKPRATLDSGAPSDYVGRPLALRVTARDGRGGLFRRTTVVELTGQPRRPYWVRGVE